MRLNSKLGLQGSMRGVVHTSEKTLDKLSKSTTIQIDQSVSSLERLSWIITVILMFIIGLFSYVISQKVLKALTTLHSAIKNVSLTNDTSNRVDITSHDEIGAIAKEFNNYLEKIDSGIKEDLKLIEESEVVMARVSNGWYSQKITRTTSNAQLNMLKNNINNMLDNTKERFVKINQLLEEYSKENYLDSLVLEGVEKNGVFDRFIQGVNALKVSITATLMENKRTGTILESSSNTLLNNMDDLNKSSNQAAASLEETASALEEVTSNITNNTKTVVSMANYGSDLKKSVSSGQNLATQTTNAMDKIDEEVNAINDAIVVIDQIAFQTNILSLNAAVEAATAGEAGKGFAVVAQEVRNLASRSAEAANEIKLLVTNATEKANEGKNIANEMIDGYTHLNTSITKTLEMISDVETASKEQQSGIEQINDAVSKLDQQTQQNASIASHTKEIAEETQKIALSIVEEVSRKQF
jgi:methyl-accepting chemotaxis protein